MNRWTQKAVDSDLALFMDAWRDSIVELSAETQGYLAVRRVPANDIFKVKMFLGSFEAQRAYISPNAFTPEGMIKGAAVLYATFPALDDDGERQARERVEGFSLKASAVVFVPGWRLCAVWSLTTLMPADDQYDAAVVTLAQRLGAFIPEGRTHRVLLPGGIAPVRVSNTAYGPGGDRAQHVELATSENLYEPAEVLKALGNPKPRAKGELFPPEIAARIGGGVGAGWR